MEKELKLKLKRIRKKGNELLEKGKYEEAINKFKQGLELVPTNITLLLKLSDAYYKLKDFKNSELYADTVLSLEANNKDALELKDKCQQKGESDLPDFDILNENEEEKKNLNIIDKKSDLKNGVINYMELWDLEEKNFFIDNEKDYFNPKLKLLEKQENGTKIVANEDIKRGELLLINKAILTHLPSLTHLEDFKSKINKLTKEQIIQIYTLFDRKNLNFSLEERIKNCQEKYKNRTPTFEEFMSIYKENSTNLGGKFSKKNTSGDALFIYPSYLNHSCDPNTLRFCIGDLFILIAIKDIPKDKEVFTTYFNSDDRDLEDRQKKAKIDYYFECKCSFCEYEKQALKNSKVKQQYEIYRKLTLIHEGKFAFSKEYYEIRNFIIKNKDQLHPFDLNNLAMNFDILARKDSRTLKDSIELFELVYKALENRSVFGQLDCAQNLASIYSDLQDYNKCKNAFDLMAKALNKIFPQNPEAVEGYLQYKHNKDFNLRILKNGIPGNLPGCPTQ